MLSCRDQKLIPTKLGPKRGKTGMKELFAQPKLKKDGTQSKVCVLLCFNTALQAHAEHQGVMRQAP